MYTILNQVKCIKIIGICEFFKFYSYSNIAILGIVDCVIKINKIK